MIETGDIQVIIEDGTNANLCQQIAYIKAGKTEIEDAVQEGIGDFNTNATEKTNTFNSNASAKTLAFNQNADSKTAVYDNNASEKLSAYNENATNKLAAYNANDTAKTEAYNLNATNKTTAFNNNASEKTSTFNDNAIAKTSGFNSNATSKTNDFNSNASSKTTAFNDNYTAKKALIDAEVATAQGAAETATTKAGQASTYADHAEIWAEGTDEEVQALGGEHSSKGWADQSAQGQVQANWNEADTSAKSYIQNKPTSMPSTWGSISGTLSNQTDLNNALSGKADTDLSNLTSTGQNIANWSTNVTNCITEIPQDIKLELNNGTLTLKAGSKVYVPNGFNGTTPKFDVVTIKNDVTSSGVAFTGDCFYFVGNNALHVRAINQCSTFTTPPTQPISRIYEGYCSSDNKMYVFKNDTQTWVTSGKSFPICLVTLNSSTPYIRSLNQVFNGFGYIGSTVFALPGVKGLIPNGRNADDSLKNKEAVLTSVQQTTVNPGDGDFSIRIGNNYIAVGLFPYDENTNYNYNLSVNPSNIRYQFNAGVVTCSSGKITSFTPKTAFHALDYNDSPTISGWSMPSSKYIDLTLGASGATYTAPANGYFCLDKAGTQNEYIDIINNTTGLLRSKTTISASGTESIAVYMPCKKGDEIAVVYTATGTTNRFRFIYAEGENV